jgi:quercetin dioxygenase-like cupin family protein
MSAERIFPSAQFFQPSSIGEPIRSVVLETADAVVVAWHVEPGQSIPAHVHPAGQDTWTILEGSGAYQVGADGETRSIAVGDIVVARRGEVHGVTSVGSVPLRFISVVCPAEAGYERLV